jgi:hypothetical protein
MAAAIDKKLDKGWTRPAKASSAVSGPSAASAFGQTRGGPGPRNERCRPAAAPRSPKKIEEVRFTPTNVTSLDWKSYPVLRFADHPDVTPNVIQRLDERSTGAGEEVMGAAVGAIARAVFDAIAIRLRQYPMTPDRPLGPEDLRSSSICIPRARCSATPITACRSPDFNCAARPRIWRRGDGSLVRRSRNGL